MQTFANHRRSQGMTLIELLIVIALAALIGGGVTLSIGALTGAKAKSEALDTAALIQGLSDESVLRGATCRLSIDLDSPTPEQGRQIRAECAPGAVTAEGDTPDSPPSTPVVDYGMDAIAKSESVRLEQAMKFVPLATDVIKPMALPSELLVRLWKRPREDYQSQGVAYIYFFRDGSTERARIVFEQGSQAFTLDLEAMTARVSIIGEALPVPEEPAA